MGSVGGRASRGDAFCARRYFVWKLVGALVAAFSCNLSSIILCAYAAQVCRSHWVVLVEQEYAQVAAVAADAAKIAPAETAAKAKKTLE